MLLTFLADSPIFSIYENIAKLNKWGNYMQKVLEYIAPFQHSNNPKEEYERIISETGFKSIFCRVEPREFTYNNVKFLQSTTVFMLLHAKFNQSNCFRVGFSSESICFATLPRRNRKLLAGFYEGSQEAQKR